METLAALGGTGGVAAGTEVTATGAAAGGGGLLSSLSDFFSSFGAAETAETAETLAETAETLAPITETTEIATHAVDAMQGTSSLTSNLSDFVGSSVDFVKDAANYTAKTIGDMSTAQKIVGVGTLGLDIQKGRQTAQKEKTSELSSKVAAEMESLKAAQQSNAIRESLLKTTGTAKTMMAKTGNVGASGQTALSESFNLANRDLSTTEFNKQMSMMSSAANIAQSKEDRKNIRLMSPVTGGLKAFQVVRKLR